MTLKIWLVLSVVLIIPYNQFNTDYNYVNSAEKETSSHCQLCLFSANLTCKYLYEHKIQQLRQTEQVPQT
jgi:hypothetical protein